MSLSLRKLTATTFMVYDAQEVLIGRVYRDFSKNWYVQRSNGTTWVNDARTFRSRGKAVAALEVSA